MTLLRSSTRCWTAKLLLGKVELSRKRLQSRVAGARNSDFGNPTFCVPDTDGQTHGGRGSRRRAGGKKAGSRQRDPPKARRPTPETRPDRTVRRNKEIASPSNVDKQQGSARLRASRKRRLGWGWGWGAPEKRCQGRKVSEVTNYAHRQDFFFLK